MTDLADPVAALTAVGDPALRARLGTAVAQFLAAITREIYAARDAAVVELRPTGSVREVAGQVGLSSTRVQQVTHTKPGPAASATGPADECAAASVPSGSEPPVSARPHKTADAADSTHTVPSTAGEPS